MTERLSAEVTIDERLIWSSEQGLFLLHFSLNLFLLSYKPPSVENRDIF
jgi:hypothetical protein